MASAQPLMTKRGCKPVLSAEHIEKNNGQFCKWGCGTFIRLRPHDTMHVFRRRVCSHHSTGCKKRKRAHQIASGSVSNPSSLGSVLSTTSASVVSSSLASSLSISLPLSFSSSSSSSCCCSSSCSSSSSLATTSLVSSSSALSSCSAASLSSSLVTGSFSVSSLPSLLFSSVYSASASCPASSTASSCSFPFSLPDASATSCSSSILCAATSCISVSSVTDGSSSLVLALPATASAISGSSSSSFVFAAAYSVSAPSLASESSLQETMLTKIQHTLETLEPYRIHRARLASLIPRKLVNRTEFLSASAMCAAFAATTAPMLAHCPAMHVQVSQEEVTFSHPKPCTFIQDPRKPSRHFTSEELQRAWQHSYDEGGIHFYDADLWSSVLDRLDWRDFDDINVFCGSRGLHRVLARNAVVSSTGAFTTSHCDTFDTLNHAVYGEKCWLVADHVEWTQAGFFCDTCAQGMHDNFHLERFLQLPSSRIIVVPPHHTLFLPRRFVHRVHTVSTYLGVGMFCVFMDTVGHTLGQWISQPPHDNHSVSFYDDLALAIVAKCRRRPEWAQQVLAQIEWVFVPSDFVGRRALRSLIKNLRALKG